MTVRDPQCLAGGLAEQAVHHFVCDESYFSVAVFVDCHGFVVFHAHSFRAIVDAEACVGWTEGRAFSVFAKCYLISVLAIFLDAPSHNEVAYEAFAQILA